jgi:hypothetical protein
MASPPISALTEDPTKVITVNFGGKFFRCSQRTYAALLHMQARLSRKHPRARIRVIQPCYNTGVALSAGTHDFDATLDIQIVGLTWTETQWFARECGWAAWWRHTGDWASPGAWHVHMTLLGAQEAGCEVGEFIPGQVDDYYHDRDGLADHLPDPTRHPVNISATVFRYASWLEANMQLTDKQLDQIADRVITKLLATNVGPDSDKVPIRTALYRASNVPDMIRTVASKLSK